MILYHFTGLRALIGDAGLALNSLLGDADDIDSILDFAAPGSIVMDGIKPRRGSESNNIARVLRSPLPPRVWLTANPYMQEGYSSAYGIRLAVAIPSGDRNLAHWPEYLRNAARDDALDDRQTQPEARERERFYLYFGLIPPMRFWTVERVERRNATGGGSEMRRFLLLV